MRRAFSVEQDFNLTWKVCLQYLIETEEALTHRNNCFQANSWYDECNKLSENKWLNGEMWALFVTLEEVSMLQIKRGGETSEMWTTSRGMLQFKRLAYIKKRRWTKYKWMITYNIAFDQDICSINRHWAAVFNLKQYTQYYNNISQSVFCLCMKANSIRLHIFLVTSICNCSPKCNCIKLDHSQI